MHRDQHFAGNGDTFFSSALWSFGPGHALEDAVGYRDSQLVLHELGIANTHQRPDSRNYRYLAVLDATQECFQQAEVEHRLGHRTLGSCLDLVLESLDFLVYIRDTWVGTHANHE